MILADEVVIYRLSDGLLLCQSLGSTGDIRCNLLFLSPWGFQLPTFRAGWCSSTVIFLSPWGFQLPTFRAGWCSSSVIFFLSPRGFCSAAILLVHGYFSAVIFLPPQGFQLPFFRVSAGCSLAFSLLGSLSTQCVPSCCSRIVYMLYQKVVHVKLE